MSSSFPWIAVLTVVGVLVVGWLVLSCLRPPSSAPGTIFVSGAPTIPFSAAPQQQPLPPQPMMMFAGGGGGTAVDLPNADAVQALASNGAAPTTAVLVHSPNCGHCKTVLPEWQTWRPPRAIQTATANALVATDVPQRWEIRGFPSLLIFQNGQLVQTLAGADKVQQFMQFQNVML